MTLPAPRDLITSLISSLSSISVSENTRVPNNNPIPSHRAPSTNQPSNPLRRIPPAYRPLLTTLHVLYPSTLLPALDLLDRRLVTRILLKDDVAHHPGSTATQPGHNLTVPVNEGTPISISHEISQAQSDGKTSSPPSPPPLLYYLVRSAQPQSHRRQQQQHSASGQVYIVRLESWNCTCAAFAFSAFPPLSTSSFPPGAGQRSNSMGGYHIFLASTPEDAKHRDADMMSSGDDAEDNNVADQPWEFGGLSKDGKDGAGGVPCCKHLLACVLAEKWSEVLGGYIEERLVGREEGAGLVGDL